MRFKVVQAPVAVDALALFPPEERTPPGFVTTPAGFLEAAAAGRASRREAAARRRWIRPIRIRILVAAPRPSPLDAG